VHASGIIGSSLFEAGQSAGLSDATIMQMADVFGYDIDLVLDIREGDRFSIVYEEIYRDGVKVKNGNILAAEFVNQGKIYRAVRYADADGRAEYYRPDGKNLRRAFIRTPVAFTRITSKFSQHRKHPILNSIRAHKGVDYAAPTGTLVKATGAGKVLFAGWQGGYGRVVTLEHAGGYTTVYGHLSRFAKGIKVGTPVRLGQTIGYVGQTGLATGPHLHYEFRVKGAHRDPLKVALPPSKPITKDNLTDFQSKTKDALAMLDAEAAGAAASAHENGVRAGATITASVTAIATAPR
jgi:murein DD-endopeptidase MepM/ murein hydrolase activator NlpD